MFYFLDVSLVCFDYTYFTFGFILLSVHTKSRWGLLLLNLHIADHVCLGGLNLFFSFVQK